LLDEPFTALDAGLRAVLRRELVELHQLWPVPLLLVTHDEADLEAVATRRLRFRDEGATRRVE
jgi:molybdate transport system ATP-binding protein